MGNVKKILVQRNGALLIRGSIKERVGIHPDLIRILFLSLQISKTDVTKKSCLFETAFFIPAP